ncbi:MAG: hypothetical protein M0P71_01245 [Melioribacteraceae bacterium]|nr:hypothetical protein [Melioribacteraceae bacterium]
MKNFLIVGSAPYIKDWWNNNSKNIDKNIYVCAMNNSWSLTKERTDYWLIPNDFFCTGKVLPSHDDFRQSLRCLRGGITTSFLNKPYWYKCEDGSGTMLLNSIYHIINLCYIHGVMFNIYIIGCDLMYNKDTNHFYGEGTADPLRMGDEWLIRELNLVKKLSEEKDFKIYNLSEGETRLPFERNTLNVSSI